MELNQEVKEQESGLILFLKDKTDEKTVKVLNENFKSLYDLTQETIKI